MLLERKAGHRVLVFIRNRKVAAEGGVLMIQLIGNAVVDRSAFPIQHLHIVICS